MELLVSRFESGNFKIWRAWIISNTFNLSSDITFNLSFSFPFFSQPNRNTGWQVIDTQHTHIHARLLRQQAMPSSTSDFSDEYDAVYAIQLHCHSCVTSLSQSLKQLPGISSFDIDLNGQKVQIKSHLPPSTVITHIQDTTGKDAVIRGFGNLNSAAVCILESFNEQTNMNERDVKGLARIVSINSDEILIDLSLNGMTAGEYYPSFRESGNVWRGALSTGKSIYDIGKIQVNKPVPGTPGLFSAQEFLKVPMKLSDLIGRSMLVSSSVDDSDLKASDLCGVIARSAGVWENDKQVCSCTGKTIWEERKDAKEKGIN